VDDRLPKLRAVDAFPVEEKGVTHLALRDDEGLTDQTVFLPPIEAYVATRMNGQTTRTQVLAEVAEKAGKDAITPKALDELVRVLDENFFLETNRLTARRREILEDFRSAPERPAHLSGSGYPDRPQELNEALDAHFSAPGAPGPAQTTGDSGPITGLVAPHIDYHRGKAGYAHAYGEVLRSGLADLYVVLGVAHHTPSTPFVLTQKSYGTPLGPVPCDEGLAAALEDGLPFDARADELVHRTEHSIEFQAVYLAYLREKLGGAPHMLPVLCSSYDLDGSDPGERTGAFLDRLTGLLEDYDGKVCLLAGVDFAHIGPRFGDDRPAEGEFLETTLQEDQVSIERLIEQDADGFLGSVMHDGNARKVCGVSALYAFSVLHKRLFPHSKGRLLHHAHAADPAGGEVTFASMVYR